MESPTPSPLSSPPLALSLDEALDDARTELAERRAAEAAQAKADKAAAAKATKAAKAAATKATKAANAAATKAAKAAATKAATAAMKNAVAQAQPVTDQSTDTPVPKKSSSRTLYIDELYGAEQPTQAARSNRAIPDFPSVSIPQIFPRAKPSLQAKTLPSSCTVPPAPVDQRSASIRIPLQQPSRAPSLAAGRAPPVMSSRAPPVASSRAPLLAPARAPSVAPSRAPPVASSVQPRTRRDGTPPAQVLVHRRVIQSSPLPVPDTPTLATRPKRAAKGKPTYIEVNEDDGILASDGGSPQQAGCGEDIEEFDDVDDVRERVGGGTPEHRGRGLYSPSM
jgi:hypothetical protein